MMTKLVVLKPDVADFSPYARLINRPSYPSYLVLIDLPRSPGHMLLVELLQPLLDGGRLEHVQVYTGDAPFRGRRFYRDMFVDEERHRKNLPRNETATALSRHDALMHEPPSDPESLPWIAGPAVLFPERRVWSASAR